MDGGLSVNAGTVLVGRWRWLSVQTVLFLVVIGTSIWVGVDASHLGVRRGRLAGSPLDMGVGSWVVCCLFLWVIAFPCYLVARGKYQAMRGTPQVYGGGLPAANRVPGPAHFGSAAAQWDTA